MYIQIEAKQYPCFCHPSDTMIYRGLPDNFPTPVTDEIVLCADDGFVLRTDDPMAYLRQSFADGVLVLTNKPVPVAPSEPEEPILTPKEKRKLAYTTGFVDGTDWHIERDGITYTCDELTQLGLQYEFRGETETADAIKALVSAKIAEIRATYPDEVT